MEFKGKIGFIVNDPEVEIADKDRCSACNNVYLTMIFTTDELLTTTVLCFKCFEGGYGKKRFNQIMSETLKPARKVFDNGYVLHQDGTIEKDSLTIDVRKKLLETFVESAEPNSIRMIENLKNVLLQKYGNTEEFERVSLKEQDGIVASILANMDEATAKTNENEIQIYIAKRIGEITENKICPTCAKNSMNPIKVMNKSSRYMKGVYLCEDCGNQEAVANMMMEQAEMEVFSEFIAQSNKSIDEIRRLGKIRKYSNETINQVIRLVERKRQVPLLPRDQEIRELVKKCNMVEDVLPSTSQLVQFAEAFSIIDQKYRIHNEHLAREMVDKIKKIEGSFVIDEREKKKSSDELKNMIKEIEVMDDLTPKQEAIRKLFAELKMNPDQEITEEQCTKFLEKLKEIEESFKKPQFIRKNGKTIPLSNYTKQYTDEKPRFRSFEKAREYARSQNLHSRTDWINHTKTSDFPEDIPITPNTVYKEEFIDYADFCGFEKQVSRKALTKEFIKQTLTQLKERWDFYSLYTDGMITDWFTTQGLFSIKDPIMRTFFTEFVSWRHKPEGREAIKYWLETGDYEKQFGKYSLKQKTVESKEEFLDRQFVDEESYQAESIIDEDEPMGIEKIMLEAKEIVPSIDDKRWFDTQVNFVIKLIWQRLFDDESEFEKILGTRQTGNIFHDSILKIMKQQYNEVKQMNYDKDYYTFPFKPTLFQLYTAWEMRNKQGFLNEGSTGSGKTGGAILAVKAVKARRVLVIVPNNIKEQWVRNIRKFYSNSFVKEGKDFHKNFFVDAGVHTTKFHVVNYDKFGRKNLAEHLIKQIKENDIDFVILDEAQLTKKRDRDNDNISTRRKNVEYIINYLRQKNRKLKVLMLSATIIINNIREGVSLLDMLTGTKYNIPTYNTIRNATRLYTEFQPFSIVYTQKNNIALIGRNDPIIVDAYLPKNMTDEELENLRWVDTEFYCTQYRVSKIIDIIRSSKGKTIIYTDYVGYDKDMNPTIVNLIREPLQKLGYRVGLFIGEDKSGLIRKTGNLDSEQNQIVENPFSLGEYDVLIVSRPFAIGIDEVQYHANTIIFNGLVWTWAEFEQIIGRLARTGQKEDHVNIHLVMARLNRVVDGEVRQADYDLKVKYYRILQKKEIGDTVRFGTLPEKVRLGDSKKERMNKLIEMLKSKSSGMKINEIKMKDRIDELDQKIAVALTEQQFEKSIGVISK